MDTLTKDYKHLVRCAWRVFNLSHRAWNRSFEQLGLSSSTFPLLEMVVNRPGIPQQEMTGELSIDKSVASRGCTQLEKQGFIRREKSADCAHGYLCHPTPKGIDACAQVLESVQAHVHSLFEDISTSEMESSTLLLGSLIEKLNDH